MSIHKVSRKSGTSYQVKGRKPDGTQYSRTFRTRREAVEYESNEVASKARGTWIDDRSGNWLKGGFRVTKQNVKHLEIEISESSTNTYFQN